MNKMKIITTDASKNLFWQEAETEFAMQTDCMHVVNVFPELKGQQIEGFGGAVTEASVYSASKLAADKREEVLKGYYGEEGLRYNLARVHIHSCDFALGNYTYVEEGDKNLSSFDVAHDREYLFPFLKEAMVLCDGNLNFLASPWSPPAYMKTNGEMNHGGKLKAEYAPLWAAYYVKFIKAYAEEGIHISYITVQNEPMAVQTWDSCIYEAAEEGAFVKNYLAPALKEEQADNTCPSIKQKTEKRDNTRFSVFCLCHLNNFSIKEEYKLFCVEDKSSVMTSSCHLLLHKGGKSLSHLR